MRIRLSESELDQLLRAIETQRYIFERDIGRAGGENSRRIGLSELEQRLNNQTLEEDKGRLNNLCSLQRRLRRARNPAYRASRQAGGSKSPLRVLSSDA